MKNMKNKVISIALALVLVLGIMIPLTASASGMDKYVFCPNGGMMSIRRTPNARGTRIAQLANGTEVTLVENVGNGWALVEAGNCRGYARTQYLQSAPLSKYQTGESRDSITGVEPFLAVVKPLNGKTLRSVSLRVNPTKACRAIRRLTAGDQLEVIASGSVFSQVVDLKTGRTGYVANDYLQKL